MALAINTLSVILGIPVRNDFAITGAVWSRGRKKGEVGSSVNIGGAHNKSQMVLTYFPKMYVPEQNLKDIDPLTLESYWREGKCVVPYASFSSIAGEVYSWDDQKRNAQVDELHKIRIEKELRAGEESQKYIGQIDALKAGLRRNIEDSARQRLAGIERYLQDGVLEPFLSMASIIKKYGQGSQV